MSEEYGKRMITKAGEWHNANCELGLRRRQVAEAEAVCEKARTHEQICREGLASFVGKNIPRRCISMQNGSVVIVEWKSNVVTVSSEELLR